MRTLSPTLREGLILSFAIDLARGINCRKTSYISKNTINQYLKAAASFSLEEGLPDPRFPTNALGLQASSTYFPDLQSWLSFLEKWEGPSDKAWALDLPILQALSNNSASFPFLSNQSATTDAIILACHTGSRSCEYCKGTTRKGEAFSKVPANYHTREWAGRPIALTAADIQFLDDSKCTIDHSRAITTAQYIQVTFRFDKGGGGNFNTRTFRRLDREPLLCPIRAACRLLTRWTQLGRDPSFPICCYLPKKSNKAAVITSQHVTNSIKNAVITAYPDPNHLFRKHIHLFRSHSVRVFACCTLVACGLKDEIIEHKLRWCSSAWKTYIRESFAEVDATSLQLFRSSLTED